MIRRKLPHPTFTVVVGEDFGGAAHHTDSTGHVAPIGDFRSLSVGSLRSGSLGTVDLDGIAARELYDLLDGVSVGAAFTVGPSDDLWSSLERLFPILLSPVYPVWKSESLDGFYLALAQKTDATSARLVGTCILISDQTVTPFCAELAISPTADSIASYRILLGESGGGALGISGPPCHSFAAHKLLAGIVARIDDVDWAFAVASG